MIVPNIYEARDTEADKHAVSAERLVEAISAHHDCVRFGDGLERTADYLVETVTEGDLVLVMGGGGCWEDYREDFVIRLYKRIFRQRI